MFTTVVLRTSVCTKPFVCSRRYVDMSKVFKGSIDGNIVLHAPPLDPHALIREMPEVKEVKEALLSLTLEETLNLVECLKPGSRMPSEELLTAMGLELPKGVNFAVSQPVVEEAKPAEKKIECASIKLVSYPYDNKIKLLKVYRQLKPGMAITDSKKLVENLPQIIVERISGDQLTEWRKELDALECNYELID
eukprot:TRINITY_DN2811_c0_g1_i1.p1 TRINITY_DN2811_c0_g1~~TRINITY_DN2811_c0_g1_i1.p1  ORF type:complete len:193 (+),score=29.07 TRINITY_DN2811_c0_g1_i1:65-643(+)